MTLPIKDTYRNGQAKRLGLGILHIGARGNRILDLDTGDSRTSL